MLCACKAKPDYYLRVADSAESGCGYVNIKGDTVIPLNKYPFCYTDTFANYAIVDKPGAGLVAINKAEQVLFNVHVFDNGPDYPAEGLFRIVKNGKMGYADLQGNVVIKPQFGCAFPFENGVAKVGYDCRAIPDGEHYFWVSKNWFHINKAGVRVDAKEERKLQ